MKFVFQVIFCVVMLTSLQHFARVQAGFPNFGIVDKIMDTIHTVLGNKTQQHTPSVSPQFTSTHSPTVPPSQHSTSAYIPVSSESVQPQGTLPQDEGNATVEDQLEGRNLINIPSNNGGCEPGYRLANGRCRKVY
jgi:hypothetical protein